MATKKGVNLARAIIDNNKKRIGVIAKYITEDKTGMTKIGEIIGDMKDSLASQFSEIYKAIRNVVAGDKADALPDDLITLSLGENANDQGIIKYSFKPQEKFPGIETASISLKVGPGSSDGKYKLEVETENADALKELVVEDLVNTYGDLEVENLQNIFKAFATDLVDKYFEAFKKILGDTEAKPGIEKDTNKTFFDTLVEKVNQKFLDNPAFESNAEFNVNYDKNIFNFTAKKDDQVVMSCQYIYSIADKAFTQEHCTGADTVSAIAEITSDSIDPFVDALSTDFSALGITAEKKPEEKPVEEKPAEEKPADEATGGVAPVDEKPVPETEKKEDKGEDEELKKKEAEELKAAKEKGAMEENKKQELDKDGKPIEKVEEAKKPEDKEKEEKAIEEAKKAGAKPDKNGKYPFQEGYIKEESTEVKTKLEFKVGDEATVDGEKRKIKAVDDKNITYTDEATGKDVTVPLGSFTEQTAVMNANEVIDMAGSQKDAMNPSLEVNHSFGDTIGKKKISKYTEDVDDIPLDSQEVLYIADEDEGKEIMEIIKNEGVLAAIQHIIEEYGDDFDRGTFTTDFEKDLDLNDGAKIAKTNSGESLIYDESSNEAIFMKRFNKRTYTESINEYHSVSYMEAKKKKAKRMSKKNYGAKIGGRAKPAKAFHVKGWREDRRFPRLENSNNLIDEKITRKINPKKYGRGSSILYTQPTGNIPGVGGAKGPGGSMALADKRRIVGRGRMEEQLDSHFSGMSISEGTLKLEDIADAMNHFVNLNLEAGPMERRWGIMYGEFRAAEKKGNEELMSDILNEDMFDFFNKIAPEGTYFGSSEGDGSDFGFWEIQQENRHPRMEMAKNYQTGEYTGNDKVIIDFLDGAVRGKTQHLMIVPNSEEFGGGTILINYRTPIAYRRTDGSIVLNKDRYSVTTSKIQNKIRGHIYPGVNVEEVGEREIMDMVDFRLSY